MDNKISDDRIYRGTGISNGKVRGKIKFYKKGIKEATATIPKDKASELKRFEQGLKRTKEHIKALENKALKTLGKEEAQIFEIHAMLLEDEDFVSSVIGEINGGKSAEEAIHLTEESYCEMLKGLGDEYLSGRVADIHDISAQLIGFLQGEVSVIAKKEREPYILIKIKPKERKWTL